MKTRFNTYDIVCGVTELQKLVGQRINQIYDVDNKTYLFRFQGGGGDKTTLLLESGTRFHTTVFEWPKNMAPSGFSMKLRKHLKNKRLESVQQLGADRIVDFKFGTGEASYHVILELYDRGNIILTDHELTILYILRPHTEGEKLHFAVREKYPSNRAKPRQELLTPEQLDGRISMSKGESLQQLLMGLVDCGPAVIEHVLTKYNLQHCVLPNKEEPTEQDNETENNNKKFKKQKKVTNARTFEFKVEEHMQNLLKAIQEAYNLLNEARKNIAKGYIIKRKEEKAKVSNKEEVEHFYQNIEFHPYLFIQYEYFPITEFDTFLLAVDEFYSTLEGQRIDMKTLQQERDVLKKLQNVKQDHALRLDNLNKAQEEDRVKADLIIFNKDLVDDVIRAVSILLANQLSWANIKELIKKAKSSGESVMQVIKQLKLENNRVVVLLHQPFGDANENVSALVELDLGLSAWANAREYYDLKRAAALKEQKTIAASAKALKSAERKTQQTLKDVRTVSAITKARKIYWFEKFFWFISSENYLVIAGRDAQQNELIVKRYLRPIDIYVHAEIQGASSVVIRNHTSGDIPPKTLLEAGTMAISYSVAWEAKVATNAYWVHAHQVSKTAPSGEYLGTGSFMIRGKKNFLPHCNMIMGLSLLFKIDENFIEKHRGERRIRNFEDENDIKNAIMEETEEIKLISDSENEDDEKSDVVKFPDTQIKIQHNENILSRRLSELSVEKLVEEEQEEAIIIASAPTRIKQQTNAKRKKEQKGKEKNKKIEKQKNAEKKSENAENNLSKSKRRNKGKLNKMKEEWIHEEIYEIGNKKPADVIEENTKNEEVKEKTVKQVSFKNSPERVIEKDIDKEEDTKTVEETVITKVNKKETQIEKDVMVDDEDNEEQTVSTDVDILNSLTGQPFEEDELHFVVPVVAPYQALQNYKFKVKLTPGTGKRGKAAKTALVMFAKDKNCSLREKDLLKSVKEEALARNIPGKVKVSTPQLQKFKK